MESFLLRRGEVGPLTLAGADSEGAWSFDGALGLNATSAQESPIRDAQAEAEEASSLRLTYAAIVGQETPSPQGTTENKEAQEQHPAKPYRGVSQFFNVREANTNVRKGEWEFEMPFKWSTSSGEDDEFEAAQSLKYGFTDHFYVELEVEQPRFGDGGDSGAGDLNFQLFYQFLEETETWPAVAAYAQARLPTGDGSSGVDGKFSTIITKSLNDRFRFHFQGFVVTANGSSGAGDDDREPFQWGFGPGFDYRIDENTLFNMNYLHRNNPTEGLRDQNILEAGLFRKLGKIGNTTHELKLAFDVGLDGASSSPNFGAKIQWGIEWGD